MLRCAPDRQLAPDVQIIFRISISTVLVYCLPVVAQDVREVYSETRCPVLGSWHGLMDPNVTIELKIRRRLDNMYVL